MPFGALDRPSVALGLFKASLTRAGVESDVAYLNLAFARHLGAPTYDRILAIRQRAMAGDWVFTGCLYEGGPPRGDSYVSRVLRAEWQLDEDDVEAVLAARALAPQFLSRVLDEWPWADYDLVGFTCSYGQTVPSLALAKLAKQRHPHLCTVFGGPTWHDIMGRTLFASFPFADAACLGEGDAAFPSFVQAFGEGGLDAVGKIPGMLVRRSHRAADDCTERLIDDLDELPIPDYADFAKALAGYGSTPDDGVVIPMETSRGCWWGARGPCRYCGMLGLHRTYRTKSAGRILDELRTLAAHPACRVVEIVDNVASPALLRDVLPELVEDPLPVPLDMDVRPGISRRTVELLAATDSRILTGIESLSERVLTLMDKGTHALESVRLLKWCRALGVEVHWNLLTGLPGETAADDEDLLGILRDITHLAAPVACASVDIERSSPHFEDPGSYGFARVRPAREYSYLFPFDERTLSDIAYFFEHDFAPGYEPPNGSYRLRQFVYDWREAEPARELRLERDGEVVVDSRRPEDTKRHQLDDLERTLYLACDDVCSRTELEEIVRRSGMDGAGLAERIDAALASFVERGLMLRRDDLFLSLALPESAPSRGAPAAVSSAPEQDRRQGA